MRQGTQRDAILWSVGANASHGMRRTNQDKRRAVMRLLEDAEWKCWSNYEIAERCAVSDEFVRTMRGSLPTNGSDERTYTTKHGTVATMRTAQIGRVTPSGDYDESESVEVQALEYRERPGVSTASLLIIGSPMNAKASPSSDESERTNATKHGLIVRAHSNKRTCIIRRDVTVILAVVKELIIPSAIRPQRCRRTRYHCQPRTVTRRQLRPGAR